MFLLQLLFLLNLLTDFILMKFTGIIPYIRIFVTGTQNYDLALDMICEQMKELMLILDVFYAPFEEAWCFALHMSVGP